MKKLFLLIFPVSVLVSCNMNSSESTSKAENNSQMKDTLSYPYKATYSSDLTVPSNPLYAQKVLTVWKLYENKQFDAMKPYYADTITYDAANGYRYHGPVDGLLAIAKKEMDKLDSLRFDISMWESVHANDKNEDWVNIWCRERSYPSMGTPDSNLMFEQWKIKDGKIYYFNQYYAKLPKAEN